LHRVALGDAFGETWFFRPAEQMQWLIAGRLGAQPGLVPAGMLLSRWR
jgi:hypothetical protein